MNIVNDFGAMPYGNFLACGISLILQVILLQWLLQCGIDHLPLAHKNVEKT